VYTEIESDEGEFSSRKDESDGSDDEVSRPVDRKKRKGGRRRAAAPARKRVRTLHQKKSQYPELEKWQPVSKRLIQKVGVAVLEKLVSRSSRNTCSMNVDYFFTLTTSIQHRERWIISACFYSRCVKYFPLSPQSI
jgi:hypothetical protein